jgi:hypothetical protein
MTSSTAARQTNLICTAGIDELAGPNFMPNGGSVRAALGER